MVTTRSFYRGALCVPLGLPFVLGGVAAAQRGVGHGLQVVGNAFLSLGAAYLVLVIALWIWSRGRSGRALQKAARLAPIFYTGILTAQQLFGLIMPGHPDALGGSVADRVAGTLLIGIAWGYIFVGLAEGVRAGLGVVGIMEREQGAPGA